MCLELLFVDIRFQSYIRFTAHLFSLAIISPIQYGIKQISQAQETDYYDISTQMY